MMSSISTLRAIVTPLIAAQSLPFTGEQVNSDGLVIELAFPVKTHISCVRVD